MAEHGTSGDRLKAAARLMETIAACHSEDRAVLLSAALEALAPSQPDVPFLDILQEVEDWTSLAMPQELDAYLVARTERFRDCGRHPHDPTFSLGPARP